MVNTKILFIVLEFKEQLLISIDIVFKTVIC